MHRCVYAIPTFSFAHIDTIAELEKNAQESQMSLTAFKDTIAKQGRDVEKSRMSPTDLKDKITKLEKNVEKSRTALRVRLHVLFFFKMIASCNFMPPVACLLIFPLFFPMIFSIVRNGHLT